MLRRSLNHLCEESLNFRLLMTRSQRKAAKRGESKYSKLQQVESQVEPREAFVVLITEAGSCALRSEDRGRDELGNHSASDPFPGLRELRELGEADRQSLREERRLLSQGRGWIKWHRKKLPRKFVQRAQSIAVNLASGAWQALEVFQHAHQNGEDDSAQGDGSDRSDRSERFLGFLGVIRRVVTAEYVVHLAFEQASTWAFRVRSRGNAMQQRLAQASRQLSEMHTALQAQGLSEPSGPSGPEHPLGRMSRGCRNPRAPFRGHEGFAQRKRFWCVEGFRAVFLRVLLLWVFRPVLGFQSLEGLRLQRCSGFSVVRVLGACFAIRGPLFPKQGPPVLLEGCGTISEQASMFSDQVFGSARDPPECISYDMSADQS